VALLVLLFLTLKFLEAPPELRAPQVQQAQLAQLVLKGQQVQLDLKALLALQALRQQLLLALLVLAPLGLMQLSRTVATLAQQLSISSSRVATLAILELPVRLVQQARLVQRVLKALQAAFLLVLSPH
tara:strand:+ start:310 stop:693 length:384 start_codon:yes stop_codon:yes gene_type:complete